MSEEKIIKKEDKLTCKVGFFWKKGSLVLTASELYFESKKNKLFSAPLKDVVSANPKKGIGNGIDQMILHINENSKERKITIQHMAFWSGVAMGNLSQLGQMYFKSWEEAINDARFGRSTGGQSGLNDLEKLADLKTKGIITEEEFTAKKKQLLGL